MNEYEIGILILGCVVAFLYFLVLFLWHKLDEKSDKLKNTTISADDAKFIMDFICWSATHKETEQSLSPLAIELYIKCHNIKKFYESEKK